MIRVTILGCGSSGGVPRIGQNWGACDPANPKNRRRRCSVLIERIGTGGRTRVLVDTGPDMVPQLLDTDVVTLDAEAFRELFQRRPALTRALAQYFARALVMERSQLSPEDLSPERRVFAALLEFVERDAVTGAWRVARMPKHRELAEKADADEAAAASAIAHLIQEGVARRDYPGLIIDDISQLNALAR